MRLVYFFTILLYSVSCYSNLGHRGGCENKYYLGELGIPENSLLCLTAGLQGFKGGGILQNSNEFKYLEFDVRETKDNDIVVYHGGSKGRVFWKRSFRKSHAMVPYDAYNRKVFESFKTGIKWDKVKVRDLTLKQITKLKLFGKYDQFIPGLKLYLKEASGAGLIRPLMVELKDIYTDVGRAKMIELVLKYKTEYANQVKISLISKPKKEFDFQTVGFMARKTKAKKIMGKSSSSTFKKWCKVFQDNGFLGIYKTTSSKANYCK